MPSIGRSLCSILSKMASTFSSVLIWRSSMLSIRWNILLLAITNLRIATNASMILMLTLTAVGLLSTEDSIATPCSVNTYGRYLRCFPRSAFKVANCDLKHSSIVSWNIKLSGNLSLLRTTCSLRRFVSTPYSRAKSLSSMTWTPRNVLISGWISSTSYGV